MQISTEVLQVLSDAETEGTFLRLTGQLDRKLYQATDKVLQACGGKWNRGKKAHVFPSDAAERIEVILTTGEVTTAREIGFFPTPMPLARELVRRARVKEGDRVLEPSAGTGNIVGAIFEHVRNVHVTAVEIDPSRLVFALASGTLRRIDVIECDFMKFSPAQVATLDLGILFDAVVMNPPFTKVGIGDHLDHVRHAFGMLKRGGTLVSILPASIEFRTDKRHTEFRKWAESVGEIEKLPDDSFAESGTKVRTCVATLVKP